MSRIRRVVFDTSTLVSAALRVGSVPHQALMKALASCDVCASAETLAELSTVMGRKKFDRYLERELRLEFVALMTRHVHLYGVPAGAVAPGSRDAKDDKFLGLVLAAEADALVSSDEDLLVMHPWRGVPVMTAAEFLAAE
ncbi:MAG TPA: putative toxin-antitoxin system toxin component, PIN family [Acidobacteriaceae bacterium]|nr:putative toxin-antitoxin system toxin component, PIN family [Acidobacteriaceae bacterium]